MFTVRFDGEGEFETGDGARPLLDISRALGIPHVSVCGGLGRCSTCRVLVVDGLENVSPPGEVEAELAAARGLAPEVRLACQACAVGDVLVRRLVHDDVDRALLADEHGTPREQELAILFSDIRGFTTFSEQQLPYDVVHILNRYFHAMGGAVRAHGGLIDKYMGDGLMALFGVDGDDPAAACRQAVLAARAMTAALEAENAHLEAQFDTHFRIGVGIHTGVVVVGSMGHPAKMQFTAIGDAVNVASRIESVTKEAGVPILVSGAVRAHVPDLVPGEGALATRLKGRSGPVELFPVPPG